MEGVRGSNPLSSTRGASDRVRRLHVRDPLMDVHRLDPSQTSLFFRLLTVTIRVRAVGYAGPGAAETVKVKTK